MASKKSGDKAARDLSNEIPLEFKCRAVATAIGAYTASGGTITVTATGALASQDGVAMAAGDLLFVMEGLSNVTAADAGPYKIVSLGGASAQVVLSRPAWWPNGSTIVQGAMISVGGEGTLFGGCLLKTFAATSKVVGTDAPLFWPKSVTQSVVLVAGHLVKTNVPIRSATGSQFLVSRVTANTCTSTLAYVPLSITAGALGTASVDVTAALAAGTINGADISTLAFTILNW